MHPKLCCMVWDFLKSLKQLCYRSPKFCLIGYVVEHPVTVIFDGGASEAKVTLK